MTKLNPDPSGRPQTLSALQLNLTLRGTQCWTQWSLYFVLFTNVHPMCAIAPGGDKVAICHNVTNVS